MQKTQSGEKREESWWKRRVRVSGSSAANVNSLYTNKSSFSEEVEEWRRQLEIREQREQKETQDFWDSEEAKWETISSPEVFSESGVAF